MTAPAATPQDSTSILLPDQPLAGEVAYYINYLASQHSHAPLALSIKIHPLNIAEGLARELAAHERDLLAPDEKLAAHEFTDPHYPHENAAARHELSSLIAEMAAPLADATLAHHLLFILTFGKNLQPPFAIDRMAICASFDCMHGILRQRFVPDREAMAPQGEPPIPFGMTLVCEPLETGFYRIPDDKRYRDVAGLLQSESPLFRWTLYAVLLFYTARDALSSPAPDAQVVMQDLSRIGRFLIRLLAQYAEADPANTPAETNAQATPKTVFGRYASPGGTAQIRNFEHQAGGQVLERSTQQSHPPSPHTAPSQEPTLIPE